MTILVMPTQICNFRCIYCFETEDVRIPTKPLELDLQAMESSLKTLYAGQYKDGRIGLHGGEPLLVGTSIIEQLFQIIQKFMATSKQNPISITTNGSKIDDSYIRLFKKYPVHIGLSCDGPWELNTLRGPNPFNEKKTTAYNKRLKKTIRNLKRNNISVGIMAVLHKENCGTPEKIEVFKEWMLSLSDMGINSGRANPMCGYRGTDKYQLTNDELLYAWKEIFDLSIDHGLRWNPIREMIDSMLGFEVSPCTFLQCNPFATYTVSVLPDGTISNCDRTFSDGLHLRSLRNTICGRYHSMGNIEGQCKGCKYWQQCGGGCPGSGKDNDWRYKTRFCEAYYNMFEYVCKKLKGTFPNIKLVTETTSRDPFEIMSYTMSAKPSAYGSNPLYPEVLERRRNQQREAQHVRRYQA